MQTTDGDLDEVTSVGTEERISELLDDKDFQLIDQRLRQFNIFEATGSIRGELRHSNFLAFILSPTRPHGVGSTILSHFLRTLIAKLAPGQRSVSALEIALADFDTTLIERERDGIDILVEIPSIPMLVVVENKILAAEGKGQLLRYKNLTMQKFPTHHKLYVFLTPEGTAASDKEYLSLGYNELASIVEEQLLQQDSSLRADTKLILSHYVEMLRRHIVDDKRLKGLARQLYERHREAFEFILESRPEPEDMLEPLRELIETDPTFVPDHPSPRRVRFALSEWTNNKELNSCPLNKWTKTGRNLLFELQAHKSSPRINVNLILGPGEDVLRKYIFSEANKNTDLFVGLTKPLGRETSTIFMRDLLSAHAAANMEPDEKIAAIKSAWDTFLQGALPQLNVGISKILESFRASALKAGTTR